MSRHVAFWVWLGRQADRADLVGDIAREALDAAGKPTTGGIEQQWLDYLSQRVRGPGARDALALAWTEYVQWRHE